MNIEADLINEINRFFTYYGIRHPIKPFRETLIDFLSYNKRFISIKKRQIYISDEIKRVIQTFSKSGDFLSIVYDAENGKDLNLYQSNTLTQLKYHDYLLNNWNIHHLHLTSEVNHKGKKKQSDDLVFAKLTSDAVYFLGFDKHDNSVFGNEKWLAIIQTNWPHLIKRFVGDELFERTLPIDPSKRQQFWEKGYSFGITNVNGVVYNDPGVGMTISGHNILVINQVNQIQWWVYKMYEWYKSNKDGLHSHLSLKHNIPLHAIEIKARFNKKIELYENMSGEILFYH